MRAQARDGFTLIELMIVVAIIGILAAIAIPKFASLIRKSREGSTRGSLGALRSALSIYYGDMEGQYPDDLNSLTIGGKYMSSIPAAAAPDYHPSTSNIDSNTNMGMGMLGADDDGGWAYWNWSAGLAPHSQGDVWVACTHTDTKGSLWSSY